MIVIAAECWAPGFRQKCASSNMTMRNFTPKSVKGACALKVFNFVGSSQGAFLDWAVESFPVR